MQPVYIQRIASIHPPKDHSPGNNRPYLQACEPDYKDIITNATLRRRMSRIVKWGWLADWNVWVNYLLKDTRNHHSNRIGLLDRYGKIPEQPIG